jgi:hypothetical protein
MSAGHSLQLRWYPRAACRASDGGTSGGRVAGGVAAGVGRGTVGGIGRLGLGGGVRGGLVGGVGGLVVPGRVVGCTVGVRTAGALIVGAAGVGARAGRAVGAALGEIAVAVLGRRVLLAGGDEPAVAAGPSRVAADADQLRRGTSAAVGWCWTGRVCSHAPFRPGSGPAHSPLRQSRRSPLRGDDDDLSAQSAGLGVPQRRVSRRWEPGWASG